MHEQYADIGAVFADNDPAGSETTNVGSILRTNAGKAYAWDAPVGESLPVGLREPELETEAVVVTLVSPGDAEHGVEHLAGEKQRVELHVLYGARQRFEVGMQREVTVDRQRSGRRIVGNVGLAKR